MTTAQQLFDQALRPMRDTAQDFFPDGKLLEYLNDAIQDICVRERVVREVANGVTASGGFAIPADVISLRWVRNPSGVEVSWLDESTFFSYQSNYPDWDPNAPLATTYDEKIWFHPAPADGQTWTVGYYGVSAKLTADIDTFPLRRQWESRAVHYLRGQMYYELAEPDMGDREIMQYNTGLRPAEGATDHQIPGRMSLVREPNAFDLDPDATHRGM